VSTETKSRLGRGLESLIPSGRNFDSKTIDEISLSEIDSNPYQPRTFFDPEALKQLCESIKSHGLAQPIVVRRVGDRFQLVAGERRFRACVLAELERVPAIVKNYSDRESLQVALVENLQREDLNAIEVATGYKRLIDEFKITHEEIATLFSRSRSAVTNSLRLLMLPDAIQEGVKAGSLTEGHARVLMSLGDEAAMVELANRIVDGGFSVRETEKMISPSKAMPKQVEDHYIPALWEIIKHHLENKLNSPVRLKPSKRGGKIEISFSSDQDLERIYGGLQ